MAEWIRITYYEGTGKKRREAWHCDICSNCRETATPGRSFWDNRTPFCPWCGEIMVNNDYQDDGEVIPSKSD